MGIPQKTFEYTAIGHAFRETMCEQCKTVYVYVIAREKTASAASVLFLDNEGAEQRAQQQAMAALEASVQQDVDPVPCPQCGTYQQAMVDKLQASRTSSSGMLLGLSLVIAGLGLFYCGFIVLWGWANQNAGLPVNLDLGLLGRIALGLVALPLAAYMLHFCQRWRASLYDPNAGNPTERIALGRRSAIVGEKSSPELLQALLDDAAARQIGRLRGNITWEKLLAICLSFFLVCLCGWLLVTTSDRWMTGLPTLFWPSVKGQMVGASFQWEDKGRERHYWPVVTYKYQVNGQSFEGHNYRLARNISLVKSTTEAIVKKLNESPAVTVYYNPRRPAEAVLACGIPFIDAIVALIAIGFGLAMLSRIVVVWRRPCPL